MSERMPQPGERWRCARRIADSGRVGRWSTIEAIGTVGRWNDPVVTYRYDPEPGGPRQRSITMDRQAFLMLFVSHARGELDGLEPLVRVFCAESRA